MVKKLVPRFMGPLVVDKVVTPVIVGLKTFEGKLVGRSHIKFLELFKRAENLVQAAEGFISLACMNVVVPVA